jgi:hypothetical protein
LSILIFSAKQPDLSSLDSLFGPGSMGAARPPMNAVRSPAPGNCYFLIKTILRFGVFVGKAHDLFQQIFFKFPTVAWTRITLIRIRIRLITLMRIRILIFI